MRLKFRDWLRLDDVKKRTDQAAKAGEWQKIPDLICEFITLCGYEVNDSWFEVMKSYSQATLENQPTYEFPIFKSKEKGKRQPWEYEGRSWYFWLNLFAKAYGWTAEVVADLDIDDAIALYQEVLVDDQAQKEWEYSLSEIAYPFDKTTKKSNYKPLGRPDWMALYDKVPNQPSKTVKIPKSAMPVGVVISLDGK